MYFIYKLFMCCKYSNVVFEVMVTLLFTALLLTVMVLVGYCLMLNGMAQPQMSLIVSEVKIFNDHRVSKKLVKNMIKNVQKPTILESQCRARANRVCRRFGSSSSSTESTSPTVGDMPATSSAHLKKIFKE